jgi:hypothetical protein
MAAFIFVFLGPKREGEEHSRAYAGLGAEPDSASVGFYYVCGVST